MKRFPALHTIVKRFSPATISLVYAAFAAAWIVISGSLLPVAFDDPNLKGQIELAKGLLFVAVTSALLFLLLRHRNSPLEDMPPALATRDERRRSRGVLVAFGTMILISPLIGVVVFKISSKQIERTERADMAAIARLKADEIQNWIAERRADGENLKSDFPLSALVEQYLDQGRPTALADQIRKQMDSLLHTHSYAGVSLVDTRGNTLIFAGENFGDDPGLAALLPQFAADSRVPDTDLQRDQTGTIHLDWVVPVNAGGPQGTRLIAAFVLRVAPERFLFPLIQNWPTESPSAETLLARREGDSLLYLNLLRHRADPPMSLRYKLSGSALPTATAVVATQSGTASGIDYRGVAVMAAYRPVAGTTWSIIAKIDRDEVLAPLRQLAFFISQVVAAATAAIIAALVLLWRQQRLASQARLDAEQRKSNTLLAQFFELPFIGMAVTVPDKWLCEEANDHLCQILGYSRPELAEKSWASLVHPDDLADEVTKFERMSRGESDGYRHEQRLIHKSGAVVIAICEVKCVRAADGKIDQALATIQDVTHRRQTEQALGEREQQLSTFVENAADIVFGLTPAGVFTYVTPNWEKLMGEPASAAIGKSFASYIHPDDVQLCRQFLARDPAPSNSNDSVDYRILHRDGSYRWHSSKGTTLVDAAGKVTGFTGVARDITDRHKAEDAQKESEARYRSVFADSNVVMLLVEASDGKIFDANAAACAYYGWDLATIRTMSIKDISTLDAGEIQRNLDGARGVDHTQFTRRHRLSSGEVRDVEVFMSPLLIEGRVLLMDIVHDITDQKRAEEAVKSYVAQIKMALLQTVEMATTLSEIRDPYTTGHERRVAAIAVAIGGKLGYDANRLEGLRVAGFLHDVGKIGVPAELLARPGKLSPAELALIKEHPKAGYEVLRNVAFPWPVAIITLQHHERMNGSGYPDGLKGDAILPEARIMAVADVVEAMSSHRPYRPARGIDLALAEIEQGRGTLYDAAAADACLELFRKDRFVIPD